MIRAGFLASVCSNERDRKRLRTAGGSSGEWLWGAASQGTWAAVVVTGQRCSHILGVCPLLCSLPNVLTAGTLKKKQHIIEYLKEG